MNEDVFPTLDVREYVRRSKKLRMNEERKKKKKSEMTHY